MKSSVLEFIRSITSPAWTLFSCTSRVYASTPPGFHIHRISNRTKLYRTISVDGFGLPAISEDILDLLVTARHKNPSENRENERNTPRDHVGEYTQRKIKSPSLLSLLLSLFFSHLLPSSPAIRAVPPPLGVSGGASGDYWGSTALPATALPHRPSWIPMLRPFWPGLGLCRRKRVESCILPVIV